MEKKNLDTHFKGKKRTITETPLYDVWIYSEFPKIVNLPVMSYK